MRENVSTGSGSVEFIVKEVKPIESSIIDINQNQKLKPINEQVQN